MQLTVVLDHQFLIDSQGRICAQTMFGDAFWSRYLRVFDTVDVVCRVRPAAAGVKTVPITNDRVRFRPVTFYEGPYQFAKIMRTVRRELRASLQAPGAVILRVPQILPTFAASVLAEQGRPYGVEVVGDPWDVYAPGAESNLFRPFFRRFFSRKLRDFCRGAAASCYVTQHALQRRYPPNAGSFTTYASSVEISEVVAEHRRRESFSTDPCRLLFVGALNRLYKGQDILLQSIHQLVAADKNVQLTIVGEGQYRADLAALARSLGVEDRVKFLGALPFGKPVFDQMDRADLYVLPSRQEGIARTVIEAMSRGLPCVSSDIGGMAEVVPEDCLVVPGEVGSLTSRLLGLIENPGRLSQLSELALQSSVEFLADKIEPRRESFLRALYDRTANSSPTKLTIPPNAD